MECREVHEMADSFLAHELLPRRVASLRVIWRCPGCRTHLGAQRALREAVRRAFQTTRDLGPTPEFATQLRMTLQEAVRQSRFVEYPVAPSWRSSPMLWPIHSLASLPGRRQHAGAAEDDPHENRNHSEGGSCHRSP